MESQEHPHPPPQPPNMSLGPISYHSMMAPTTARLPSNNNNNDNNVNTNTAWEGLKPYELASDSAKKKRGRPRKHSLDANIALGLAPTPTHASSSSTEPSKKSRGRPLGSGKKQMDPLGTGGTSFTPHVIFVDIGEVTLIAYNASKCDIIAKVMAFCQQAPRTVCILSANGAIRNATFQQAAISGGTVTYEGQFEIISLSGSILPFESNSGCIRMGSLSVSLAGSDGRVMGGAIAGVLTAASQVQVIAGSFIADSKKSSSNYMKSGPSSTPSSQMLTFVSPLAPTSPTSQGPSTESSDDNENTLFSKGLGLYNNASQPIHNVPMYHHQVWAGQTHQ
ncbi:hypothetical protein RJT34_05596 [Clitoria ternatea]|uniref:AT-hook motif nuclear-localized protein n=1 Tax=Clitoria ternatea TaxID=43366 RepID=A0AAN9K4N5_CLITE